MEIPREETSIVRTVSRSFEEKDRKERRTEGTRQGNTRSGN